ncbi:MULTISPECIES: hypothetical protein [unclassified Sphingomonas]|uniref:hypothetical protein n=1 Tax=unclassified Sphingomonas TaxID=196159 RepID=UPI00120EB84B|nr:MULTISPECIES: hypothetical protein [unclassified Sphingomonas]MBD8735111.1 hypothetical protein [Sphingomonas sp. CFBP 13706]MBP2514093.1 hypothetical protein [Sphingomonas sp. PvP018]RZM10777.1 MAG: hypothetical protein EOP68_05475 [Sphingomonas sp.]
MSILRHLAPLSLIALLPFANATAATQKFVGAGGTVRLAYPSTLTPTRNFAGRALMTSGWRTMWDGTLPGRGVGIVRFWQVAKPTDGQGQVTEMIQVGFSRSTAVIARCTTDGLTSANSRRLADRTLGGQRWTTYETGDAGMSQQVRALTLRSVIGGTCYAVDRITYAAKAGSPPPRNAPTQAVAAARMDAILKTVKVGRRR